MVEGASTFHVGAQTTSNHGQDGGEHASSAWWASTDYGPPRSGTAGSVHAFRRAGIQDRMATGYHRMMAAAIAREIRLLPADLSHSQRGSDRS
ncbi:hypothetical protein V8E36_004300 [Tilletia maclaganii]